MFSHFSTSLSKKDFKQAQSGFGMIELLISISIIVIVTSIVLVRQTSFNGAVLLRSQAYEVALQIRSVQLSAVSASPEGGSYRSVVGLHFNSNDDINNGYSIFSDANGIDGDGYYDSSEDSEFGIQGLLDPRFEIGEVRADGTAVQAGGLSVVFIRPDFDAEFANSAGSLPNVSSVEIDIARKGATGSGLGDVRTVEITSTGQISVN